MKKNLLVIAVLLAALSGFSQPFIQGSIQQGTAPNSVNVNFLPTYPSASGESLLYLSISIAIPTASATGVTPSIATTGAFATTNLIQASPFSYTAGTETIYSWIYDSGPGSMTWTAAEFTGAVITFTGGTGSTKVRIVDFTNYSPSGGNNLNTLLQVVTNKPPFDVTNYTNFFYAIAGTNGSVTGLYGNADQYAETKLLINMGVCNPAPNAGTVSGTSPLCIGATATYTSDGDAGGSWSSTNPAVATVNATTGLVTAVSAGNTDITYTAAGCTPVSSFKTLTVNPTANAGTVSGSSPLCIAATTTYTSNGDAGGAWSSTNPAAATVNAASGLVTAVAAGTTDITYTVSTGCGSPVSSFKTLTVNANVNAGTVSGSSPICIGSTTTYTSNGTAGGSWSSTNAAAATVNAASGLVTAVAAGTTDITYTVTGCGGPLSSFKTLTVNPGVSAGTVSGTSPLLVGATATYTSNGTAGGSWSSTTTATATVNAATGLVTAVAAGTTDITYTVNTGCGSPVSSFKTLTISTPHYVQASVQQGATTNSADIRFLPNYTSASDENLLYLSLSIAIPTSSAAGVTPVITTTGPLTGINMIPASPFSYTAGTETIYSWIYDSGPATPMTWTSGVEFTGATINFGGGTGVSKVRLVDFTNSVPSGGNNLNTLFLIVTNKDPFDVTNYGNMFYQIAGGNGSVLGSYGNGDQFVESSLFIDLPVGLLSFSGYKDRTTNKLQWTTANEINNLGFEVQRSADGTNYSAIGFVSTLAQGGNSATELKYSFDDINPAGKKQYYRLRQVDIDHRGKLSNTVLITGDKPLLLTIGGLFPNPAHSIVNLIVDAPARDRLMMVITDMTGRVVRQQMTNVEIGSNTIPIEISNMANGGYIVKLVCQEGCAEVSGKFIKQ